MSRNEETRRLSRPLRLPASALAAGLGVVCLASCWLGVLAGRPFVIASRMRSENARIERKINDMRMDVQAKRKDVAALNTDAGREQEARRLGFVREGERQLIIPAP